MHEPKLLTPTSGRPLRAKLHWVMVHTPCWDHNGIQYTAQISRFTWSFEARALSNGPDVLSLYLGGQSHFAPRPAPTTFCYIPLKHLLHTLETRGLLHTLCRGLLRGQNMTMNGTANENQLGVCSDRRLPITYHL